MWYKLLLYRALRYRYTVATRCCETPPPSDRITPDTPPRRRRRPSRYIYMIITKIINGLTRIVSVARRNYDLRYYIILLLLCAICIYIMIIYDIINLLLYAVDEMKQKIKSKSTSGVRCPLFIVNKNTVRLNNKILLSLVGTLGIFNRTENVLFWTSAARVPIIL